MILLDSSLLLNDFFHRNPEYGSRRSGKEPSEELLDFWQKSHEALLRLSLETMLGLFVAEYVPSRLASILSDLGVPRQIVYEELIYWNGSFHTLKADAETIERILEKSLNQDISVNIPTEDIWMTELAKEAGIRYILSPWRRQESRNFSTLDPWPLGHLDSHDLLHHDPLAPVALQAHDVDALRQRRYIHNEMVSF